MLVTCSEAIRRSHTTQVPIQNENSWKSWFLRFSSVFNDNVNVQIFGKGAELFSGGFPVGSFQKYISYPRSFLLPEVPAKGISVPTGPQLRKAGLYQKNSVLRRNQSALEVLFLFIGKFFACFFQPFNVFHQKIPEE